MALATVPPPPPKPAEPSAPTVVLMVPDRERETVDEELISAVQAHATPSVSMRVVRYRDGTFKVRGLDARSKRRAGESAASAVMWVDLRSRDVFALYVFESRSERLLRRRIPVAAGAEAAAIEGLANIAASAADASTRGQIEGLVEVDPSELAPKPPTQDKPEPKPQPKPEPKEPVAPDARFARLWLSAAYAGNTFADEVPWQSGIAFAAAWMPVRGAFVGARYDVVFPSPVDSDPVSFDIRRHPVSVIGGYRFQLGPKWDLELGGRVTVDPVVRHTDTNATSVPASDDGLRIFSGAGLGIGIGFSPIRQVRLALGLGADALFTRAEFVANLPERRVVLDPHPARFVVDVGLHFGLIWREKRRRPRASNNH